MKIQTPKVVVRKPRKPSRREIVSQENKNIKYMVERINAEMDAKTYIIECTRLPVGLHGKISGEEYRDEFEIANLTPKTLSVKNYPMVRTVLFRGNYEEIRMVLGVLFDVVHLAYSAGALSKTLELRQRAKRVLDKAMDSIAYGDDDD